MKSVVNKLLSRLLILIAMLPVTSVFSSETKPQINWLRLDFIPLEIAEGPLAGQGEIDNLRKFVISLLPEYQHAKAELVSQGRLNKMLQKDNVCHAAMLKKPDLIKIGYMSVPYSMAFPHHLITTQEILKNELNNQSAVSLNSILADTDLKFGLPNRTLGFTIDSIVEKYLGTENVNERFAAQVGTALIDMLLKGRIDYIIDHQPLVDYWNKINPSQKLVAVSITELEGHVVMGRVICSKNAVGKKIIQTLNKKLLAKRQEPDYIKWLTSINYTPRDRTEEFAKHFRNSVLNDEWTNAH